MWWHGHAKMPAVLCIHKNLCNWSKQNHRIYILHILKKTTIKMSQRDDARSSLTVSSPNMIFFSLETGNIKSSPLSDTRSSLNLSSGHRSCTSSVVLVHILRYMDKTYRDKTYRRQNVSAQNASPTTQSFSTAFGNLKRFLTLVAKNLLTLHNWRKIYE